MLQKRSSGCFVSRTITHKLRFLSASLSDDSLFDAPEVHLKAIMSIDYKVNDELERTKRDLFSTEVLSGEARLKSRLKERNRQYIGSVVEQLVYLYIRGDNYIQNCSQYIRLSISINYPHSWAVHTSTRYFARSSEFLIATSSNVIFAPIIFQQASCKKNSRLTY